ncbi:MAG: hypothetical protein WHU95_07235 [candidate division WOR-3 bacterium]|jgi:hypothetical protein|nr:hypothetical protein [candidate division WOR-3 bacterium]MDH7519468.1 hypothetical protein [bacterium]
MKYLLNLFLLIFLVPLRVDAAEYNGQNIDGIIFSATVYSYSTGEYYYVDVEFDRDEATIYFQDGGYITVSLDGEEIDDPHNILAYDYQRSVFWDIDVDGLD